jgi:hypothetical protein
MSDLNHAPLWYPPQFPLKGRLPDRERQVKQNIWVQGQQERDYHHSLQEAAGHRVPTPCCKTLHITLCFDGTNNNLNNDLYDSEPPHPTNIARLFRASIGEGHAGGTVHRSQARGLVDAAGTGNGQFFKYYMPGVGTPFPEIGDLDYSLTGLAFGARGEDRLNWALLMLIDALRRALGQPRLDNAKLAAAVSAMGTVPGMQWGTGHANRSRGFHKQLAALYKPLSVALKQPYAGQPKLLGLKLYVYGFSRGAAAARALVSWLNRLLAPGEATPCLAFMDLKLPISVEYLGLLDTVASVGLADVVPVVEGHMGWADGSQELPEGALVKRCLHLFSAHEQRLSFPLESIRRPSGEYPANSLELIYPGVHSDVGGGYPRGDQGKAVSEGDVEGDGLLLSQIPLNDLYADAYSCGAPLKVPADFLPADSRSDNWRALPPDMVDTFYVSPQLAIRFNAWRQLTLDQAPVSNPLMPAVSDEFRPLTSRIPLEDAIRNQMAWLTAWRIDRYALSSLKSAPFYLQATDTHADEPTRKQAESDRNNRQAKVRINRMEGMAGWRYGIAPKPVVAPGVPDFDPDIAQTQLREAAEEFRDEYQGPGFLVNIVALTFRRSVITGVIAHQYAADARAERERMKAAGEALVSRLFPRPQYKPGDPLVTFGRQVDESRNAEAPEGLLRALFDDQVHDSRAWFLYAMGREFGGHYFSERMVFFGNANRRELVLYRATAEGTLVCINDRPQGDIAHSATKEGSALNPEQTAKAMKAIDALWDDYHATLKEIDHGQA